MMYYPENQEEFDEDFAPDLEDVGQQDAFMQQLDAYLEEDNDLDDELDQRVDEVMSKRRRKVVRGGLFGV